jgi:G:T/U-mismatch repair DNA glycosylase
VSLVNKDAIFLRPNLDLLFVALNPPNQSNINGHYFSGKQSLFYKQLYQSGLITTEVDKMTADDLVFGSNKVTYKGMQFGIVDLIPHTVETDSSKVNVTKEDVKALVKRIYENSPRVVCVIHSKVKREFEKLLNKKFEYGYWGKVMDNCDTKFYCNYFPNGNSISSKEKLTIYKQIRNAL